MLRSGFALAATSFLLASFAGLMNRPLHADEAISALPSAANAVARVQVKELLATPLARKENWQSKMIGGYSTRPLAIPAYASDFVLAGYLQVPDLAPMWQISVTDVQAKANLDKVAREQKAIVDLVNNKVAVTTPADIMHVVLSDTRIATLWPAQRQLAVRLMSAEGVQRGLDAYLAGALKAGSAYPVVMALDLTDAYSGPSIRKAMAMGGLASLDSAESIKGLSDALAGVKGVTVQAKVADAIDLRMVADFAAPPPIPAAAVKPFCLEMLASVGLQPDQFANLQYQVTGNQIVATGPVTPQAVGSLLALLVPDPSHAVLESAVAPASGGDVQAQPAEAKSPAQASQDYYRAVANMIDRFTASNSMSGTAALFRANARKIQQLPVLNVDPELLDWGASVGDMFSQCAMIMSGGQAAAVNAAGAIESPVGEASYSETGASFSDTAGSRANFRNAQQDRRNAAQAERSKATDQVFGVITNASKERAAIRSKMTQKYGVEF